MGVLGFVLPAPSLSTGSARRLDSGFHRNDIHKQGLFQKTYRVISSKSITTKQPIELLHFAYNNDPWFTKYYGRSLCPLE
jgi:hypothetical protein